MSRRRVTIASIATAAMLSTTAIAGVAAHEWQARPMLGANEVPANASVSEARASLELEDGAVKYKLRMRAPITGAFMAHIHRGPAGANGPIVAWLFGDAALGAGNATVNFGRRDVVARGEIEAANLVGPLAGRPLSELVDLLNSGNAYVNLHTRTFPAGELRAQIELDD